ncbi:MAG: tRNA pseudouridine(55) synthase TruB [Candidatus Rokuibacteriota bacterium]
MSSTTRSGVLVVIKAAGMTSFDVVALVRRRLGVRRVGHAGTLDPDATGVLPILIGEATKLMAYIQEFDKEYVVTVRFGVRTDTLDLGGRVLSTAPVPVLDREHLSQATRPFVGRIKQVPPMYSAIHHEGQRLYELARKGLEVPRERRSVLVQAIDVEGVDSPRATFRIVCGKGTYVRALIADLGESLGCGAAVEHLVRARVGAFEARDAVSSAEVASSPARALWAQVLPPESALTGWPVVRLETRAAAAFLHGQTVTAAPYPPGAARFVAVHATTSGFLGVGEFLGGRVKPARILHANRPGPRVLPA